MARCGNCTIEFKNKEQQVKHSLEVHESAFVDGSEDLQAIQERLCKENPKYQRIVEKAREV